MFCGGVLCAGVEIAPEGRLLPEHGKGGGRVLDHVLARHPEPKEGVDSVDSELLDTPRPLGSLFGSRDVVSNRHVCLVGKPVAYPSQIPPPGAYRRRRFASPGVIPAKDQEPPGGQTLPEGDKGRKHVGVVPVVVQVIRLHRGYDQHRRVEGEKIPTVLAGLYDKRLGPAVVGRRPSEAPDGASDDDRPGDSKAPDKRSQERSGRRLAVNSRDGHGGGTGLPGREGEGAEGLGVGQKGNPPIDRGEELGVGLRVVGCGVDHQRNPVGEVLFGEPHPGDNADSRKERVGVEGLGDVAPGNQRPLAYQDFREGSHSGAFDAYQVDLSPLDGAG